ALVAAASSSSPAEASGAVVGTLPGDPGSCPLRLIAEGGMRAPEGGTFRSFRTANAKINDLGVVAFYDRLNGVDQDEVLMTWDSGILRTLVRGCGGPSGTGSDCGDPTPIGGTYSIFYQGTVSPPSINSAGDIAFFAGVIGGSSPQGLFLYRQASGAIESIAALADASPQGGTFDLIGPPVLTDGGDIFFSARDVEAPEETYLVRWRSGTLTRIIGPGDTVVGGSLIDRVPGGLLIVDGLRLLLGPIPFIRDDGSLLVNVRADGIFGILESTDVGDRWIVRTGDPENGGDTVQSFRSAIVRGGRYAFSSGDVAGIFLGTPGNWQSIWRQGDLVDGSPLDAFSSIGSNRPTLDDFGQFTLAFRVLDEGLPSSRLLRWNEENGLFVLARTGEAAPNGGLFSSFSPFMMVNARGDALVEADILRDGQFFGALYVLENCLAGQIFAGTFEDGTTDAWSQTVP
ncbi:MAG: hypothetical protein AAF725_21725, partial [Acidobacteriota bacterium]